MPKAPPAPLMVGFFFLSGFLTLVYEICWLRKAATAFGATTYAVSTVLAVFFAGLSLGSYLLGRYSRRTARPLRAYAYLEVGVGVLALLSPLAFILTDRIFGAWYGSISGSFAMLSAARFVLVVIVLLPPSILIGGTLPLFCRQYVVAPTRIARSVGLLYGVNTLGAALGCAACGLWMIPRIGIDASIYLCGAVNVSIGIVVWWMTRDPVSPPAAAVLPEPDRAHAARSPENRPAARVVPILFFLSGFIALGSEILWIRFLSLIVKNTVHTYTLTLTVVLGGIVIGSLLAAALWDRVRRRPFAFGIVQIVYGLTVLTTLLLPLEIWAGWFDASSVAEQLWIIVLVLISPAVLSGMSFPLAIRIVVDDPGRAGPGVGRMTAINTLGGIVGSLVVGFGFLTVLGLHATLLLITGISVVLGLVALLLPPRVHLGVGVAVSAVAVLGWIAIPRILGTGLPADLLATHGELVEFQEGRNSHLAVIRDERTLKLEIDRLWQGEDRKTHQIMAAHVPMHFRPRARSVAVVGLGVGQTAARFLMYDIERLDCVEIEERLIPLVRRHFESEWMDDPRVSFVIEDGRNYLAHTEARYDVVSIEVGQVFRPGIAGFYTREFYERSKRRLKPDGILSQFVPVWFFDLDEIRTVVATFLQVFPDSVLWYNRSELLLIGANGGDLRLDPAGLERLQQRPQLQTDLEFSYWGGPAYDIRKPEVFLAGFLAGPDGLSGLAGDAAIYHDDLPHLEYSTATAPSIADRIEVVRSIQSAYDPIGAIVARRPGVETIEAIESIRQKNTNDIVTHSLMEGAVLHADRGSQEATPLLQQALQWNPENATGLRMLGNLHQLQGRPADAARAYRQSLQLDPDFAEAHDNLGNLLLSIGRNDEAVEHLRRAIALDPSLATAHYHLGVATAESDPARAQESFRRALGADPGFADAHFRLGNLLRLQGDLASAVESFREALRIRPDFAECHFDLANALKSQGNFEEAVTHYESTLELRPDHAAAHNNLANTLRRQGNLLAAIRHLEEAVRLSPDYVDAHLNLGMVRAGQKQLPLAIEHFRKAVEHGPGDARPLQALARALAMQGEFEEAVAIYRQALEIDPGNSAIRRELATAEQRRGSR